MKLRWFPLLALLFSTPVFAYPSPYTCTRNFYVATTGSDVGGCGLTPGTSACASIQGANNNIALVAGDCVNVGPGTYNMVGAILTKGGNANTATGYVTYKGAANQTSKLNESGGTAGTSVYMMVPQAPFIIIDGFEIAGNYFSSGVSGPGADVGIIFSGAGSHHYMFLNNLIHDMAVLGISNNQGGDYYTVAGNVIYNTSNFTVCNGCGGSGIGVFALWPSPAPNGAWPWDTQTYHVQILDNIVHDAQEKQTSPGHTDGNCIIIDTTDTVAFGHSYNQNMLIAGNVVYNCGGNGLYDLGNHVNAGGRDDWYNNVAYNTGIDPLLGDRPACESLCNNFGTWANNVCYTTNNNGTKALGQGMGGCSGVNTSTTWSNNLTFNGTVGQNSVSSNITIATDGNLFGVNPQLANVAAADFHPLAGSPVLGAGVAGPTGVLPGPFLVTPDGFSQPSPPNVGVYNSAGPPPSVIGPVSIRAGGSAVGAFISDAGFSGGSVVSNWTGAVDTSLVANPAPQAVYQSERYGTFSYTVSGLTASKAYTVNLHFTEDFETAAGKRLENVIINGTQALSNFDIFASAGAQHKAIVKTFTANADASGNIAISLAPATGSPDTSAKVDGVEVLAITPSPTASLTSNPNSIISGNASTLTWSSTNATSCTGTGFSTGGAVSGSVGVSPSATTTYTVSCTNGGTPATASVIVTVTAPAQTSQIEDFQYLSGDWYLPDLALPAAGTTGVPGASTIRCVPAGLRNKATINNVGTRVYTADSAGHLQFAIYANGTNMRPSSLVSTSTSMSLATAGVISSALSSKVQGGPGGANFSDTFWFCANTDSTKATFSSVNASNAFGQSIIGTSTAGNVLQASGTGVLISHLSCSGGACNGGSSTYGTWPTSLAGTLWTEQTTIKMPMMAIQFVSVP